MTTRPRYGTVGMYPEPIPDTCYDARHAAGEQFWDEWQERNKTLDADSRRRAQKAMQDPNSTCGASMSPATKPDENDCYRELYEPAHDQMIRDLIAKYDCAPGGGGAATPASRDKKASGQSTKSNALLYGLGALAVLGIGYAIYATKYANNPVGETVDEVDSDSDDNQ